MEREIIKHTFFLLIRQGIWHLWNGLYSPGTCRQKLAPPGLHTKLPLSSLYSLQWALKKSLMFLWLQVNFIRLVKLIYSREGWWWIYTFLYIKTLCGGFTGRGAKRHDLVWYAWSCASLCFCGFLATQPCHSDKACICPLGKPGIIIYRLL